MKKCLIVIALCAPVAANAYFEIRQDGGAQNGAAAPAPQGSAPIAQSSLPGVGQPAPRDEDLQVIANRRLAPLRHSGVRGNAARVEGFGEGIPLDVAIEMIIPQGWAGLAARDVNPGDHKVSWSPEKTWVDTLEDFALNTNHEIEVDWARQEVIVRPQKGMTAMERNQLRALEVQAATRDDLIDMTPSAMSYDGRSGAPMAVATSAGGMSLEAFLAEPIRVDLRAATAEQVLLAALPPGYTVELLDVNPSKLVRLLDVTTPIGETRRGFLHLIGQELGVSLTPFPHLGRLVMTDVPR